MKILRLLFPSYARLKLLVLFICGWGVVWMYVYGTGIVKGSHLQVTFNNELFRKSPSSLLKPVPGYRWDILLYSAVVGNSSNTTAWDKISVQGWLSVHLQDEVMSCCVKHRSGRVKQTPISAKMSSNMKNVSLTAIQVICYVEGGNSVVDPPEFVTIIKGWRTNACSADQTVYLKTAFAYRHPGEIAIFGKLVFGNLTANSLLSWVEIHKLFGFNKVYFYPTDLNENANRVLEHYRHEGIVEILPFAVPGPEHGVPLTEVGTKNQDGWTHKRVALFDGLERLRGYDYVITFDVDEYLIPERHATFRELFDANFGNHPLAAGATLFSYLHLKNWGPASNGSTFEVASYLYRSELTNDRAKHVIKPDMVEDGGYWSHGFSQRDGLVSIALEDGAIHHYRSCRHESLNNNSKYPCYRMARYYDDSVYKHFKRVEKNILSLKRRLGV